MFFGLSLKLWFYFYKMIFYYFIVIHLFQQTIALYFYEKIGKYLRFQIFSVSECFIINKNFFIEYFVFELILRRNISFTRIFIFHKLFKLYDKQKLLFAENHFYKISFINIAFKLTKMHHFPELNIAMAIGLHTDIGMSLSLIIVSFCNLNNIFLMHEIRTAIKFSLSIFIL